MIRSVRQSYRELLGGPNSLNFQSLLYLAPNTVLCSILDQWHMVEDGEFIELLFANLISLLACAAIFFIFRLTCYRNRATKPVALAWVALYGLSMGFAKEFFTRSTLFQLGELQSFDEVLNSSVVGATLLGIFIMPTMSMATSLMATFKENRTRLIIAMVKDKVKDESLEPNPSQKSKQQLEKFISYANQQLSSANSPADLARRLRSINNERLRPLSHKLWQEETERISGYSFADLQALVLKHYLFDSKFIGLIDALFTALFAIQHFGPAPGALFAVISGAFLWLTFALAKRFAVSNSLQGYIRALVVLVINIAFDAVVFNFLHHHETEEHLIIGTSLNIIWLFTLVYVIGLAKASLVTNQDILEKLSDYLNKNPGRLAQTTGQAVAINREFAEFLHSDVQNKFLQTVLAAESAETSPESLRNQVTKLRTYLANLDTEFRDSSSLTAYDQVLELGQTWNGLAKLQIDVSPNAQQALANLNQVEATLIIRAINEAITNALRHGFANEAELELDLVNETLRLVISDNGTGPKSKLVEGLGFHLYKDLTNGDWSLLARPDGGAELTLNIPLA